MSRAFNVSDLVDEVRSLVDEFNEAQLETERDIVSSLGRSLERAHKTLSMTYPEGLAFYTDIAGINTREYTLPEDIFEDKIIRMEWFKAGEETPKVCQNTGLKLFGRFVPSFDSPTAAPIAHIIYGRKIRFNATPNGIYTLRIWAIRDVERPVLPYGRISGISGNSLFLTEVNENFDPSVASDLLSSYVNVIDGQTGEVKGSLQILNFDGADTVAFKSSPDRGSVLNRNILTSLTNANAQSDDYLCSIKGSCVLYMFDIVHSYVVQASVAEMKRKLGYAYDVDQKLMDVFLNDIKTTFMGREGKMRINQNNPNWIKGSMRRFYRGFRM
jgi:hypothetical protein